MKKDPRLSRVVGGAFRGLLKSKRGIALVAGVVVALAVVATLVL